MCHLARRAVIRFPRSGPFLCPESVSSESLFHSRAPASALAPATAGQPPRTVESSVTVCSSTTRSAIAPSLISSLSPARVRFPCSNGSRTWPSDDDQPRWHAGTNRSPARCSVCPVLTAENFHSPPSTLRPPCLPLLPRRPLPLRPRSRSAHRQDQSSCCSRARRPAGESSAPSHSTRRKSVRGQTRHTPAHAAGSQRRSRTRSAKSDSRLLCSLFSGSPPDAGCV